MELILLFGMPRSGTTWLGKIFDSHPDTLYRHEPDKWPRSPEVPHVLPWKLAMDREPAVRAYLRDVLLVRRVEVSGKLPVFPKSYHSPLAHGVRLATILGAKLCQPLTAGLGVPELAAGAGGRVHLIWKSTDSVCRVGAFLRLLDGARGIHLVRHPCGQIASVLRGHALGEVRQLPSEYSRVLEMLAASEPGRAHGLSPRELAAMPPLERMAWMWVISTELALAETEGLPGCATVRYEDLCRDPVLHARELFELCGLAWSERTSRFIERSTRRERDSYYGLFKDPARTARKWRDQLSAGEIERIAAIARTSARVRAFVEEPDDDSARSSAPAA